MSRKNERRVPVEEEARKREAEDALLEPYDADDPRSRVGSAHADDPVAEELAKEAVRDLTEGGHAVGEKDDEESVREHGGPFVETTAAEELATDDDTEPAHVEPAPRPRATGGRRS